MRNILEIYKHYKIMPNLQLHQLRVTSVAFMIFENLDYISKEEIDKDRLLTMTLLHDMGNIIKFNLEYFPDFNQPEGLEYWKNVQNKYFEKYGKDEHHATILIMKELKIEELSVSIVESMTFGALCIHKDNAPLDLKILHYSDMRVGPHGILSYEKRMEDVKLRYSNIPNDEFTKYEEEERDKLMTCGKEIERQIFEKCKIKPEDINNESTKLIIEELKGFMVR